MLAVSHPTHISGLGLHEAAESPQLSAVLCIRTVAFVRETFHDKATTKGIKKIPCLLSASPPVPAVLIDCLRKGGYSV